MLRLFSVFLFVDFEQPKLWEYGMIVQNILNGNGYSISYDQITKSPTYSTIGSVVVPSAYMPPVYVFFLALFLYIFGYHYITYFLILFVQSLIGTVGVIVLYWLTERIFSKQVAVIAGYICAIYPPFLFTNTDFGPATLYMTLVGLLLLIVINIKMIDSKILYFLGGIIGGLVSLTRGEGIIIVIGYAIWLLFTAKSRRILLFIITLIIFISPWFIRNYISLKGFIPVTTSSGLNFWRGNNSLSSGTGRDFYGEGIWSNPTVDSLISLLEFNSRYEIERNKIFINDALLFIGKEPGKEFLLSLRKVFYLWILDITHPRARTFEYITAWGTVLFFFIIGILYIIKNKIDASVLLIFFLTMTIISMFFFVLPRYQIILTYGIIPISASGIYGFYNSIFKRSLFT